DHAGIELVLDRGDTVLPLRTDYEYAMVVLDGAAGVDGSAVEPGNLGYLGLHREELRLTATEPTRLLLLGGVPFESPILMWWNFVGRTREEIDEATASWEADDGRFGSVATALARIPAAPTPWPKP